MAETLIKALIAAEENEKRQIARELHDHAAQLITAISLTIEDCRLKMPEGASHADSMDGMVSELAQHIRDLSFDLRPPMLDDFGFVPALTALAGRVRNESNMHIDLDVVALPRLASYIETTAFRIVQRALTHASTEGAANASVRIEKNDGRLDITVITECDGLAPGTRERVLAVGGNLTVEKVADNSTRVAASLPIEWRDTSPGS